MAEQVANEEEKKMLGNSLWMVTISKKVHVTALGQV
jgi:hypothetical protein